MDNLMEVLLAKLGAGKQGLPKPPAPPLVLPDAAKQGEPPRFPYSIPADMAQEQESPNQDRAIRALEMMFEDPWYRKQHGLMGTGVPLDRPYGK